MVFQELSGIPIICNPLTLLEGAAERGLYKGSLKGLTSFERQRAVEYIDAGSKLERIEEGTTKTADFVIDSKKVEFRALTEDTLNANTVVEQLKDATKKEGVQVIDLDIRKPGGPVKDTDNIVDRFKGTDKGKAFKGDVRVATRDGLKKYKVY